MLFDNTISFIEKSGEMIGINKLKTKFDQNLV